MRGDIFTSQLSFSVVVDNLCRLVIAKSNSKNSGVRSDVLQAKFLTKG